MNLQKSKLYYQFQIGLEQVQIIHNIADACLSQSYTASGFVVGRGKHSCELFQRGYGVEPRLQSSSYKVFHYFGLQTWM